MTAIQSPGFLRFLRALSLIEGCSTLVLFFVAMPLKYMANMPLAVTIFGSLHGILFLLLVGCFFAALDKVPISLSIMLAGIVGAVIPFGPFLVDRRLKRLANQ